MITSKNIHNHLQLVQGFNCRWVGPAGPLLRISWLKGLVAFLARGAKESHQKHRSSWSYREEWWLYRIKKGWNPGKKGDVNQQRWDLDRWSIANRLLKMQHGNENPFLPGKPSANGCAWGIYNYHIWQMFPMQWSHGFGLQSLMFPGFGQGFHLKLRF